MPRRNNRLRRQIERAASDPNQGRALRRLINQLGPVGRLIESIIGIFGRTRRAPSRGTPPRLGRDRETEINRSNVLDALKQLEDSGWVFGPDGGLEPPAPPPPGPWVQEAPEAPNVPSVRRVSQAGDPAPDPEISIRTRTRQESDPYDQGWETMTAWTLTPGSSNVYGFAYDTVANLLYVTYQNEDGTPGPMYSYGSLGKPVPVSLYNAMLTAQSTGRFVWDNLRVRGTVWGHQFPYTLVGTGTTEYVPRKATRRGFRTRTISAVRQVGTVRQRRLQRSSRPERLFNRGDS